MSIAITNKGLEINEPTQAELASWERIVKSIEEAERERINDIIEQFIENSDYPEVVSSLQWLQDVIKGENK